MLKKLIKRGRSISPSRVAIEGNQARGREAIKVACPYCDKAFKGSRGVNVHLRSCKLKPSDPKMEEWLQKKNQKYTRAKSWTGLESWIDDTGKRTEFRMNQSIIDMETPKIDFTKDSLVGMLKPDTSGYPTVVCRPERGPVIMVTSPKPDAPKARVIPKTLLAIPKTNVEEFMPNLEKEANLIGEEFYENEIRPRSKSWLDELSELKISEKPKANIKQEYVMEDLIQL